MYWAALAAGRPGGGPGRRRLPEAPRRASELRAAGGRPGFISLLDGSGRPLSSLGFLFTQPEEGAGPGKVKGYPIFLISSPMNDRTFHG